jgi:cyclophilin family peptidyl-prolyl cis-trans isomerase
MIPVSPERNQVGSHWFVNLRDNPLYDTGGFTGLDIRPVFGTVTGGLDVVDRLTSEDTVTGIEIRQRVVDPLPLPTRFLPLPFPTLRPPIFVP